MSWTSSASASTLSPYFSVSGASVDSSRAVAATLSPRSSAASAQMRPKPFEQPVMNQTFESAIRPPGGDVTGGTSILAGGVTRPAVRPCGDADRQPRPLLDRDAVRARPRRRDRRRHPRVRLPARGGGAPAADRDGDAGGTERRGDRRGGEDDRRRRQGALLARRGAAGRAGAGPDRHPGGL